MAAAGGQAHNLTFFLKEVLPKPLCERGARAGHSRLGPRAAEREAETKIHCFWGKGKSTHPLVPVGGAGKVLLSKTHR